MKRDYRGVCGCVVPKVFSPCQYRPISPELLEWKQETVTAAQCGRDISCTISSEQLYESGAREEPLGDIFGPGVLCGRLSRVAQWTGGALTHGVKPVLPRPKGCLPSPSAWGSGVPECSVPLSGVLGVAACRFVSLVLWVLASSHRVRTGP